MKHALIIVVLLLTFNFSQAQLGNIVKDHVKNRVNNDVGNETDKALDQVDPTKKKNNKDNNSNQDENNSDSNKKDQSTNNAMQATVAAYQNYDFRAGDKIIFEVIGIF